MKKIINSEINISQMWWFRRKIQSRNQ